MGLKVILLASALFLAGCATTSTTVSHPGAINAFDSNSYDALLTAKGAIDAARPLVTSQAQKDIFNKAVAAYDVANHSYLLYHSAAASGGTVDTTTLTSQLTALVAATANLVQQIQGAK